MFGPGGCPADSYYSSVCERTGVCLPEYYPPIGENEEGGVAQLNLTTNTSTVEKPAMARHEKAHDHSGAEKSVVCLAAVMTNYLVYVLMF